MSAALRRFVRRLCHDPFETLIALLAVFTALFALFRVGGAGASAYDAVLPHWAATLFQIGYLLSGLLLLGGVGASRADVESAGLVIIAASQVARAIVNVALIGLAAASVSVVFSVLVVGACGTRLWLLVRAPGSGGGGG